MLLSGIISRYYKEAMVWKPISEDSRQHGEPLLVRDKATNTLLLVEWDHEDQCYWEGGRSKVVRHSPEELAYFLTAIELRTLPSRLLPFERTEVMFSVLAGKTIVSIDRENIGKEDEFLRFITSDEKEYVMCHEQECCERVNIEDICGDLRWLLNSEVLLAEESSQKGRDPKNDEDDDSWTWTFYRLQTANGLVTIRWYGGSNGYYSESVSLYRTK